MSTKSYILIPYSLWDHKVQSWWKSSSSLCPLETIEFLEAKKIIFLDRYGLQGLHFLVFKWVRYISTKSYTRKRCRTLRKKLFSIMGYAKIHKQRPFFHNKESISKKFALEIQMVSICFGIASIYCFFVS
jgi:hypothetical protein